MTNNSRSTSTPSSRPPINRHGSMAWEHWERHRHQELRSLTDPESHFRQLGQMVEHEIEIAMTTRLTAEPTNDQTVIDQIRREVEEEMLMSHVLMPPDKPGSTSMPHNRDDPDLIDEIPLSFDSPAVEAWRNSPLLDPTT